MIEVAKSVRLFSSAMKFSDERNNTLFLIRGPSRIYRTQSLAQIINIWMMCLSEKCLDEK